MAISAAMRLYRRGHVGNWGNSLRTSLISSSFFAVACITTKFSLHAAFAVAFASAAAWFNSIERIPFPFIFFIVSLELIKGAQTETL